MERTTHIHLGPSNVISVGSTYSLKICYHLFFFWENSPQWAMASPFVKFLDKTQRHTTAGRTPLG